MILLCSLAVYKAMQVILSLLPREPMPWVKVLAGVVLGLASAGLAGGDGSFGKFVLYGLSVATLAGAVHTVMRLVTYLGDLAARKSTK